MSQQELERSDQEVMDMVNSGASPQATQNAEDIAAELKAMERETAEMVKEERVQRQTYKRREGRCVAFIVAACIAVAILCVLALKYSGLVIWLVNAAVLCCGIVAAVNIDRWIRKWRKY